MYVGIGINEGIYVNDEDAYHYALDRCLHGTDEDKQEFKDVLIEWFFSGMWVKEEGNA